MEKVIELSIEENEVKKYLEELLTQEHIEHEFKIEERWHQHFRQASEYYQVCCLYVNNNDINKVQEIVKDFENATIITDDVEELKNVDDEEDKNHKNFTIKNFLGLYFGALIIIGIIIIIGIKFFS